MTTIIAMVVLLGVVILIHEWGHYAAARLCGIRVDVFSIGFGPRIWGWKRGSTDYRVSILPLGGYVKMAGDNPMEERAGAADEFLSKPRWQRAVVAVAGPVMNIVLTLVVYFAMVWHWGNPYPAYYDYAPEVVAFPADAAGAKAGLLAGDRITEINESPISNWRQVYEALGTIEPGDVVRIKVTRNGETVACKVQRPSRDDATVAASIIGYEPIPPVILDVAPGYPAAKAGLKAGDHILAVNDQEISLWGQFRQIISGARGEPVSLRVKRGEEELSLTVTPAVDPSGRSRQIGVLVKTPVAYEPASAAEAFQSSLNWTEERAAGIFAVLGGLFRGRVSFDNLGGVIEIGRQAGNAARDGLQTFVALTAFISLNLAILNLLPIPILDGGHLLMLAIEGTLRRDLSVAVKERFLQFGMVLLLVVFVFVMYNDVSRVFLRR